MMAKSWTKSCKKVRTQTQNPPAIVITLHSAPYMTHQMYDTRSHIHSMQERINSLKQRHQDFNSLHFI